MFALRTILLISAVSLAACGVSQSADESGGAGAGGGTPEGDPGQEPGNDRGQCAIDSDCVAVASTCCECPTYAVPGGEFSGTCDAVECGEPGGACSDLIPKCLGGSCELVCGPIVTEKVCDFGFVSDASGCLLDLCATVEDLGPECSAPADCVQVPADCCGCARGGRDTAVPAGYANEFSDSLDCTGDAVCPEVDVCEADSAPTCVAGRCQLVSPITDPGARVCGTNDAPTCPIGQVCVLNGEDGADLGVGTCQPE